MLNDPTPIQPTAEPVQAVPFSVEEEDHLRREDRQATRHVALLLEGLLLLGLLMYLVLDLSIASR